MIRGADNRFERLSAQFLAQYYPCSITQITTLDKRAQQLVGAS